MTQIKRAMSSSSSPSGGRGGTQGPGADPTSDLDIAIVFVSAAFGNDFDRLVPLLRERLPSLKHVFGCSVSARAAVVVGTWPVARASAALEGRNVCVAVRELDR